MCTWVWVWKKVKDTERRANKRKYKDSKGEKVVTHQNEILRLLVQCLFNESKILNVDYRTFQRHQFYDNRKMEHKFVVINAWLCFTTPAGIKGKSRSLKYS